MQSYKARDMDKKPFESLDFREPSSVCRYGYRLQEDVAELSDRAVKVMAGTDLAGVNAVIADLLRRLEAGMTEEKKTIFGRLRRGKNTLNRVKENYAVIDPLIKELEQVLTNQKLKLHMCLAACESCLAEGRQYAGELAEYLDCGREKLRAQQGQEPSGSKELLELLKERLSSLEITQITVTQFIGQLERMAAAAAVMLNKINHLLKSFIPLWRSGLTELEMLKLQTMVKEFNSKLLFTDNR